MTIIHDGDPCACGSRSYGITATLIDCRGCGRIWGRVNGLWVLDPDSEPPSCPYSGCERTDEHYHYHYGDEVTG